MNLEVHNLKDASVEVISQHVRTYGSMSIEEMIFIDQCLITQTKGEYDLTMLFDKIKNETTDPESLKLLNRIVNNFTLYKDILAINQ